MGSVRKTPYAGAEGKDAEKGGRASGPPRAHAEAGEPTRAWPKADPAVTRPTLVITAGEGNTAHRAPGAAHARRYCALAAGRTTSSFTSTSAGWETAKAMASAIADAGTATER